MYRTGWVPQDGYLVLMPGMKYVWKIVLEPTPNAGNYIFSVEDLEALDWDVYAGRTDEKKKEEDKAQEEE